jgi:hypothetical protein
MKSKKHVFTKAVVALAASLVAQSALAVDYSCDGPVNGVTVGPSGVLSAASAGGQAWGYFCQVNGTSNNISPEACRGMLAVLLTAQASGKQVRIWFRDDNSCSTNRGWAWLSTMYWGPAVID